MSFETDYPSLSKVLGEVFESAGSIKLALADGHVSVDEIVSAIPDAEVQAYVREMLLALSALPGEVHKVVSSGPWGMMSVFQALAVKAMALFK